MNIDSMLAEIKTELDNLTVAIQTLERLAYSTGKRRGRPPAAVSESRTTTRKKRKPMSAATRAKMAEAQKARWAAKKKG